METSARSGPRFALPHGKTVARIAASPVVVIGAIVLGAFLATLVYTQRVAEFYVMPDELSYVKQALAITRSHWLVRPEDFYFSSYSQLQPLLMAPAYGLFDGLRAFDVAHALNAAAQASTAIPAYLLARRVLPWRPAAYLVALLTVITPWAAMSGSMMSENATYPASVWGALAVQHAIVRPSIRADLLALAGIGLAFFGRSQFYLLAVALALAIVLHEIGYRLATTPRDQWRASARAGAIAAVRGHPVLVGAGALAIVVALGTNIFKSALGSYATVQDGQLLPPGTLDKGLELVENVVIAVACLPLALTLAWVPLALVRPRSRDQHAYAAFLLVYLPLLVVALGSFSVRFTAGPNDRYMFYILPLLFIGMLAMLLEARPNRVGILVGAGLTAWLAGTAAFALTGPSMVAPSAAFHAVMIGRTNQLGDALGVHLRAQTLIAVATVLAAIVLIVVRTRVRPALVAVAVATLIGGFTFVETVYTIKKVSDGQATVPNADIVARGWVDKAIGSNGKAATIISLIADVETSNAVLWETSFWNESVRNTFVKAQGDSFSVGAATTFQIRDDGTFTAMDGYRYLVVSNLDRRFALRGARVLAQREPMILLAVPPHVQAEWTMQASDDSGLTPIGKQTTIRVYGDGHATRKRVGVQLTPLFQAPQGYRFRLSGEGREATGFVRPHTRAVPTVDVDVPAHGFAEVHLTTLRPRKVLEGPPTSGLVALNVLTDPSAIARAQREARGG